MALDGMTEDGNLAGSGREEEEAGHRLEQRGPDSQVRQWRGAREEDVAGKIRQDRRAPWIAHKAAGARQRDRGHGRGHQADDCTEGLGLVAARVVGNRAGAQDGLALLLLPSARDRVALVP